MPNTTVKNQIELLGAINTKMGNLGAKNKFAKIRTVSNSSVQKVEVDTDLRLKRGDVVKVVAGKAKYFTGAEGSGDEITPAIVVNGNSNVDGYMYAWVLTDGLGYVYTTEAVTSGRLMAPADDETTPTPLKRFVQIASGAVSYWIAQESAKANTFVKVKFSGGGGGGSVTINIAKVKSRSAARTYVVDIYSGWAENYTLPAGKLLYEDEIMKTPMLNDTSPADQLDVGTTFNVVQQFFTEDEAEVAYWTPIERVGLP